MNLKDKVVAITGAYKGLGAALSEAFANKGCRLVLGGRNEEELEKFSAAMKKLTDVVSVIIDVRKKEDNEQFVKATIDKFGRLDILINNAGVWWKRKIDDVTEEDAATMFETNTFGPLWCTKAALEVMKRQDEGCIINIGSVVAVDHKSSHLLYAASKSALLSFTGCLAENLKNSNIRMVCFCPGGMKTNLFRHNPERFDPNFMDTKDVADYLIKFIESDSKDWLVVLRRFE